MRFKLSQEAKNYIERQDKLTKSRIYNALRNITKVPPEGDVKPLQGYSNKFRLRVGKYRVIYEIVEQVLCVNIIDTRGDVYKKEGLK